MRALTHSPSRLGSVRLKQPHDLFAGIRPCSTSQGSGRRERHRRTFKVCAEFWIGANIPWNSYGNDCGRKLDNPRNGPSRDYYETAFQNLSAAGANTVRFWLFADGRSHPFFQSNLVSGTPSSTQRNQVIRYPGGFQGRNDSASQNAFEDEFWSDFQYLLDRAQHYGIGLIPVLWDFHAMDDVGNMPYTPSQHGHKDLFSNEALVTSYIDLALIPLVSNFKNHSALLAWDLINEPEWAIESTWRDTGRSQLVPPANQVLLEDMQRFVARCAAAIHEHGGSKPVTVGSNSLQFSWPFPGPLPHNAAQYWVDDSLNAAYHRWNSSATGNPTLDFYQCHFYTNFEDRFNPSKVDASSSPKKILIGEVQVSGTNWPPPPVPAFDALRVAEERRAAAEANHYAGILYWSYGGQAVTGTGDTDTGKLSDFAGAL